jgi:Glyoxalase-like domain
MRERFEPPSGGVILGREIVAAQAPNYGRVMAAGIHLDVEPERLHDRAAELMALGASRVAEFDEPQGRWITLRDREGNEFCLL